MNAVILPRASASAAATANARGCSAQIRCRVANGLSRRDAQQRVLDILRFKLDIPWSMLDAIEKAYPA